MEPTRKYLLGWTAFLATVPLLLPAVGMAAPKPPKHVISMKKARSIAVKVEKGKIKEGELEFENKIWIYSFDIMGKDKKIHEVNVDALTGKIVSQTIETAASEAMEAKGEHKKKSPAGKEETEEEDGATPSTGK